MVVLHPRLTFYFHLFLFCVVVIHLCLMRLHFSCIISLYNASIYPCYVFDGVNLERVFCTTKVRRGGGTRGGGACVSGMLIRTKANYEAYTLPVNNTDYSTERIYLVGTSSGKINGVETASSWQKRYTFEFILRVGYGKFWNF